MKPFTIVVPERITDLNLLDHSIPETEAPQFDGLFSYAEGDLVIYQHFIYESLQNMNLGNLPGESPEFWLSLGPTNQFAAFDEAAGTFTTANDFIEFEVVADRITSMGFLEIDCSKIIVIGTHPNFGEFYNKEFFINSSGLVSGWYAYFFGARIRKPELVITDIPALTGATFTIRLEPNAQGISKIGTFVMGRFYEIGDTALGAKLGIIDYSVKETDALGRTTLVERTFKRRNEIQVFVKNSNLDSVYKLLQTIRARNVLYIGASGLYESLTTYGFFRDFSLDMQLKKESVLNLQIEGLTG